MPSGGGIHTIKYWFSVLQEQQQPRFESRGTHPLEKWRISTIDLASPDRRNACTQAKKAMFFCTDTAGGPWTVIETDDKMRARLACMQRFLTNLPNPDRDPVALTGPDLMIVDAAEKMVDGNEPTSSVVGQASSGEGSPFPDGQTCS